MKTQERTSVGENVEKKEPCALLMGMQTGTATVETVWRFLKKLKIELPYDSVIPLLAVYPRKMKTLIQKDVCIVMSIAALFTRAKIWKKPNCPSIDKWIKKMCHIYICTYTYTYI